MCIRDRPKTLDRILYLDVDIVVIQSLRELYNMDFESNLYIASSHVNERMTHLNAKRLGLKEDVPYINTGVLLMVIITTVLTATTKPLDLTLGIEKLLKPFEDVYKRQL